MESLDASVLPAAPRVVAPYQPVTCVCAVDAEWWSTHAQGGAGSGLPAGLPLFCKANAGTNAIETVRLDPPGPEYVVVSPEYNHAKYNRFFGVLCGATPYESCTRQLVGVVIEGEATMSVYPEPGECYRWCKLDVSPTQTFSGTGPRAVKVCTLNPVGVGASKTDCHCFLLEKGRKPYNEARVYLSLSASRAV